MYMYKLHSADLFVRVKKWLENTFSLLYVAYLGPPFTNMG